MTGGGAWAPAGSGKGRPRAPDGGKAGGSELDVDSEFESEVGVLSWQASADALDSESERPADLVAGAEGPGAGFGTRGEAGVAVEGAAAEGLEGVAGLGVEAPVPGVRARVACCMGDGLEVSAIEESVDAAAVVAAHGAECEAEPFARLSGIEGEAECCPPFAVPAGSVGESAPEGEVEPVAGVCERGAGVGAGAGVGVAAVVAGAGLSDEGDASCRPGRFEEGACAGGGAFAAAAVGAHADGERVAGEGESEGAAARERHLDASGEHAHRGAGSAGAFVVVDVAAAVAGHGPEADLRRRLEEQVGMDAVHGVAEGAVDGPVGVVDIAVAAHE